MKVYFVGGPLHQTAKHLVGDLVRRGTVIAHDESVEAGPDDPFPRVLYTISRFKDSDDQILHVAAPSTTPPRLVDILEEWVS